MTDQIQDVKAQVKNIKETLDRLEEELKQKSSELFTEGFAHFFEKYPFLGSVVWTQYTPYFNDGDECVFGSNHTYAAFNSVKDLENGTDDCYESGPDWYGADRYEEAEKEIKALLKEFSDETMKRLFGDHAIVTVTRDGAEVSDYDHD